MFILKFLTNWYGPRVEYVPFNKQLAQKIDVRTPCCWQLDTLYNRPCETRPSGFFPSPSENLASPVPGEIFDFTRPVCGFPGAAFTYLAYIISV